MDRFIADGLAEPELLGKAPPRSGDDRLMTLVAGMTRANPDITLAGIGAKLEAMYERTPSGGRRWAPGSVKSLIDRARKRRYSSLVRPRVILPTRRLRGPTGAPNTPCSVSFARPMVVSEGAKGVTRDKRTAHVLCAGTPSMAS